MLILFLIFFILGSFMWVLALAEETGLGESFFKDKEKRRIACLLLGPGAWFVELVKITVFWTSDLLTPLFDWLQSPKNN